MTDATTDPPAKPTPNSPAVGARARGSRSEQGSGRGPLLLRLVLAAAALAVLVAWSRRGLPDDPAWGAFLVFTGLGSIVRLVRRRAPTSAALIFVGAGVVVLGAPLAVWCAALVGAAALLRGDALGRVGVSMSTLVLSAAAGSLAKEIGDTLLDPQPFLERAEGGIGLSTALVVGLVLALSWQILRWWSAWLDRRAQTAVWQVHAESRWLRDITFAATAVIAGLAWLLHPPLILLVLVPLLTVGRMADTNAALTGTAAGFDPLTSVGTAGMLRVALAEELARSERFDRPLSVLVVDVDRMGAMNKTYGREAGDEIVRVVAERVGTVARDYDVVARIGGDAFAVLLPEAELAGARAVADRMRAQVADEPVQAPGWDRGIKVTVSIGVATYPGDADQREALLTEAELAANYARLEGGNRVADAARLPAGFHGAASAGRAASPVPSHMANANGSGMPAGEALVGIGQTADPGHDRLVRATGEPFQGAKPRSDRLLIAAGLVAAAAAVVSIGQHPGIDDIGRLLLFAGIAIGAEWFSESIYGRANASWAAVPLVALAATGAGPASLVLAAAATAIGGGLLRGVRVRQAAYNTAVLVLAGVAAYGGASAALYLLPAPAVASTLLAGLVGGVAFFVVDTWLVGTAVAVANRAPIFQIWREDLAWLVPHQLGMGVLGGAMAFAHDSIGVPGTLVLVLPALGLHFAQRQFVSRTREHVVRLRALNDDLQYANSRVVRVNERLTEALEQVNQGYLVTVESLAAAVDAKDSYTGSHIDRVEAFGRRLLEVLDPELSDDDALLWGFRLHDVGKIGVPDSVLLKPGPLDEEEWELMRRHPEIGAQIVEAAPFLQGARDVILHHHERWDGRGYPHGLGGAAIPFSARAFACIDAFDAMTSDRPYRRAMPIDQALRELLHHAGTQFDPEMIEAFVQIAPVELQQIRDRVDRRRGRTRLARAGGLLIPIAGNYAEEIDRIAASR